jgi:6-pyruvoyltetrahydropterin/6-carboxytetrahydropterin synthase
MNFSELKKIVEELVIKRYDHVFLNDLDEYKDIPTTAENMAQQIFNTLDEALLHQNKCLQSVMLFETPTSWATVTKDD